MRPSLIALLLVLPTVAHALPTGITGYSGRGGGSTCSGCHSGTATALTITGGPAKSAGMNVALGGANSANAVFTAGTGTRLSSGELVHSAPAAVIANVATFSFAVKAPLTAGVFTLSAAALSTNNDSLVTGDGTGTTSLDVNVSLTASSPPVGTPDGGGVAPVLPGTDAGTPAPASGSDAGTAPAPTVKPDAGAPVEGEGCSATGGMPLLGLVALALLALARRSRPVAVPVARE